MVDFFYITKFYEITFNPTCAFTSFLFSRHSNNIMRTSFSLTHNSQTHHLLLDPPLLRQNWFFYSPLAWFAHLHFFFILSPQQCRLLGRVSGWLVSRHLPDGSWRLDQSALVVRWVMMVNMKTEVDCVSLRHLFTYLHNFNQTLHRSKMMSGCELQFLMVIIFVIFPNFTR